MGWALLIGSFWRPYLTKKAENWTTHEDMDKLVEQMQAVTQTTKEIEAKISGDLWDRQRRWEMRKDAIFDALKQFGDLRQSIVTLRDFVVENQNNSDQDGFARNKSRLLTSVHTTLHDLLSSMVMW